MTKRKLLFFTCMILSVICWLGGYALLSLWPGAVISLLLGVIWWLAWKNPSPAMAGFCLVVSLLLGGAGVLLNVSSWLMICGAVTALGAWDLLSLNLTLGNISAAAQNQRYENQHLKTLLFVLGGGLLLALLGELLAFQIPFFILLLLVAGLVFLLERFWNFMIKRQMKI